MFRTPERREKTTSPRIGRLWAQVQLVARFAKRSQTSQWRLSSVAGKAARWARILKLLR